MATLPPGTRPGLTFITTDAREGGAMPGKTKKTTPDTCRLTATIRGESYDLRPNKPAAGGVTRAWRLKKADGTAYDVADAPDGPTCTCADFAFRHKGADRGCKHVRALRSLGLLDNPGLTTGR